MEGRRTYYTLVAIDGADHDGCTLYVMHGFDGEPLLSSSWPQPLEHVAKQAGIELRVLRAIRPDEVEIDLDDQEDLP